MGVPTGGGGVFKVDAMPFISRKPKPMAVSSPDPLPPSQPHRKRTETSTASPKACISQELPQTLVCPGERSLRRAGVKRFRNRFLAWGDRRGPASRWSRLAFPRPCLQVTSHTCKLKSRFDSWCCSLQDRFLGPASLGLGLVGKPGSGRPGSGWCPRDSSHRDRMCSDSAGSLD